MSRISLLMVAAAVAAGVVGCAQCDTCDDFPAPCTGPNCGQNEPGILDSMPPGQGQPYGSGTPTSTMGTPAPKPATDSAGPAPMVPPTPSTPDVNPGTPPTPPASEIPPIPPTTPDANPPVPPPVDRPAGF